MASSPDFVAYVLDLLAGVAPVEARRMFGGHGIFHQGLMIAILDDDELYLKADEAARSSFEAAGCQQWCYSGAKGDTPMPYWRPPDEAHESAEAMQPWAELAVGSALRRAAAKAARAPRGARGAPKAEQRKAPSRKAPVGKAATRKAPARQSRR